QWQAPAECPDADSVKLSVERLLGQKLADLQSKNVRAHGEVRRNEVGNWELHCLLSVGDRVEEETFAAKKCQALADAMALKIALAIDPLAVVESVEPAVPASPPTPPVPSSTVTKERPVAATSAAASSVRYIGLRATGGAGFGPLPGVTAGAALYSSIQLPAFRVELGGQVYSGGVARYAQLPNVGAHLQLFSGAARACLTPGTSRLTVPICGGLELGVIRGEGFGIPAAETSGGAWGAAVIGPALHLTLAGAFALWVEGDAVLTLLRPEFHARNLDSLYTPPEAGARFSAGLEVDLGL
ncbi:MAG TPA: hypothetical protein VGF76_12480, partial [Polyangiaceae bacterium]